MDPRHCRRGRRHARCKVVLRLVEIPIGQVIETQIELDAAPDLPGYSEVEDRQARGHNRRVVPVEAVMIDGAQAQGTAHWRQVMPVFSEKYSNAYTEDQEATIT
jgi:hypothetical protein